MKFGNIELKHGVMLAPMAGFSDRAMRVLCREHGCEYSVSEMISATAVAYGDKKTFRLARILGDEGRVAIQIFGSEPAVMAKAAATLSVAQAGCAAPVAIDINMGCPVHKIFSNGEGSALMKSPERIYEIVRAVSGATPLPTTVKLRLGIDRGSINAVECALAAEEGGAALVTVHGRTRVELYSGNADYEAIRDVKQALHIPVIANGDITSGAVALSVLDITGADGVAVGRGAVGNPFIFREIISALEDRPCPPPTLSERKTAALHQLTLAIEEKGEEVAVREARKQIASYFHSFRGAGEARAEINRATTLAELEAILSRLFGQE